VPLASAIIVGRQRAGPCLYAMERFDCVVEQQQWWCSVQGHSHVRLETQGAPDLHLCPAGRTLHLK
jgi:hypothetical protein